MKRRWRSPCGTVTVHRVGLFQLCIMSGHERAALPCARSLGSCQAWVTRVCHWWHYGDTTVTGWQQEQTDRQHGDSVWQGQTPWLGSYNYTPTSDRLIWQTAITLSTGGAVIAACVILGRPVTVTNHVGDTPMPDVIQYRCNYDICLNVACKCETFYLCMFIFVSSKQAGL